MRSPCPSSNLTVCGSPMKAGPQGSDTCQGLFIWALPTAEGVDILFRDHPGISSGQSQSQWLSSPCNNQ